MSISEEPNAISELPAYSGAAEALFRDIKDDPNVANSRWQQFIYETDPSTRIMFKTILNQIGNRDPYSKELIAKGIGLALLYEDKIETGKKLDKEFL